MKAFVWLVTLVRSTVRAGPDEAPRQAAREDKEVVVRMRRHNDAAAKFGRVELIWELAMKACVTSLMLVTLTTPPMPTSPPETLTASNE